MKKILLPLLVGATMFASCSKNDNDNPANDFESTKDAAIANFVNVIALPAYEELKNKGTVLNNALNTLTTSTTDANLEAAKTAWKDMRSTWEKTEGFLFGPVDDDEHDPETDTWPVNHTDMDNLLASATPLKTAANIEALGSRSLKGYHPIEYILWGVNGNKAAIAITAREKDYLNGLSAHLKGQADALYTAWIASGGNYAKKFLDAGKGSDIYAKKQDAFIQIVDGMVGICGEVGDGKMVEPFEAEANAPGTGAQLVESPFSGNSIADFKNNIIGAYSVYQGKFNADGTGIQDLVKLKNAALNVQIQQKFETAINSFDNITVKFEVAIVSQRQQCQATMNALTALADLLDTDLRAFVIANITD